MDEQNIWKAILRVNMRFVLAYIALFYGWLCWQGASKEWWALYGIGVLAGLSGAASFIGAASEGFGLIKHLGKLRRFKGKGVDPHEDPKAGRDALKDKGMIR